MKSEGGRQLLHDLVKESDVLVENYLPGKLAKMGLGYDELSKINPKLIYASITGYGQTGPYANRPGYDVIIEVIIKVQIIPLLKKIGFIMTNLIGL
jgi:succinate--hydroxymethylglutarate CoA-transferase